MNDEREKTYRKFLWECTKCWTPNRITGSMFTSFKCRSCGEEKSHPNTGVPNHCPMCCRDKKICSRCGGPMD
jgi:DNA-directed RNA polymerase subunit RPC12/RpoP